jgi:Chaperone of endosialidase
MTDTKRKTYEKPALAKAGVLAKVVAEFSQAESDRRLKSNVARVGTTVFGLPLYRFSYLGSDQMFTGVMAQDVLGVMPGAVSRNAAGFYRVDYRMLGIEMKRAA